jgi:hypothetical protein
MLRVVDNDSQSVENNIIPFRTKGKGVRMLNLDVQDVSVVVKAKLLKPIAYNCFGVQVMVPAGTEVTLDVDKMVAFIPAPFNAHTDVSMDEVLIQYQN